MTVQFDQMDKSLTHAAQPIGVRGGKAGGAYYAQWLKRGFDLAIVLIAAPFVVPVILLLALVVSMDGGAPIYRSNRVGRGGRVFAMYKIRTMLPNSARLLQAHLAADPQARREWQETQKLKRDPRITGFGRFLRKSSLDELPQLFNVLLGHMSLVGPRPMLPEQRQLYPGDAYYEMRPGLTGLWQVSDRNASSFAKRAEFDRQYFRHLSLIMDLWLIARTFRVVFKGTGY